MKKTNIQIPSSNDKPILLDFEYQSTNPSLPVIIFCHGLKGFKDWGAWDLMGSAFAKANYLFIKFNFSHNGGTPEQPIDFPDLEAFGKNNYSLELRDLDLVINWLEQSDLPYNPKEIHLMGHSRAGGITTITAANDPRIASLTTLAGVADYEERFPTGKELEQWKIDGVQYVKNGRTNQDMPFYYQMYEDFLKNRDKLDILKAASRLTIPHLIIHGTADSTVDVEDAYRLHAAHPGSDMAIIRNANHVFGAAHPWTSPLLPNDLRQAIQCILNFLNR